MDEELKKLILGDLFWPYRLKHRSPIHVVNRDGYQFNNQSLGNSVISDREYHLPLSSLVVGWGPVRQRGAGSSSGHLPWWFYSFRVKGVEILRMAFGSRGG
jgi:hypothetical protein